jgi:hypothetical protein
VGKGKAAEGLKCLNGSVDMCSFPAGKPPLDVNMNHDQPSSKSASTWTWFPSWRELRTHYFKEVGFLACLAQMIGATIFVSTCLFFPNFHLILIYTSYGNVGRSYSSAHYSYNQILCYLGSAFTSTFCFSNCRHFHFMVIIAV